MTQADSVSALGMSLDPKPTPGQRQAEITATTPLPTGWASFCSSPDSKNHAHWYATAPWHAEHMRTQYGEAAQDLMQTVDASSWPQLHKEVAEQVALYGQITAELK